MFIQGAETIKRTKAVTFYCSNKSKSFSFTNTEYNDSELILQQERYIRFGDTLFSSVYQNRAKLVARIESSLLEDVRTHPYERIGSILRK